MKLYLKSASPCLHSKGPANCAKSLLCLTWIQAALLLLTCIISPIAIAKKDRVKPSKTKKVSPIGSYKSCRKDAIKESKSQKNKKAQAKFLRGASARCKDMYPAVSVLISCRKDAIRSYKDNKKYMRTALKECKESYKDLQFQGDKPNPLTVIDDKLFFAGIGLNKTRQVYNFPKPAIKGGYPNPNTIGAFDCNGIQNIIYDSGTPEYIMFGNDPRSYVPLKQMTKKALIKSLKIKTKQEKFETINPYLGQVVWHRKSKTITNYFPLGSCNFSGADSGLFQDIKIYYLIDKTKERATPYFAIAFYKDESKVAVKQLIKELKTSLGKGYLTSKSKSGLKLISKSKVKRFDYEGDPRNLCQLPREHKILAAVSADESKKHAKYLVVANLDNLCKYGDRFASRLLKKGLK